MSARKDKPQLSLSRRREMSTTSSSPSRKDGAHGNEVAAAATPQSKMASQLKEILTSDETLLSNLADTIVDILLSSDSLVNKIAERLEEKVTNSISQACIMDMDTVRATTNELKEENTNLKRKINKLEDTLDTRTDELEQYSRRNCLLIHGIQEHLREDTNDIVIDTVAQHLNVNISPAEIDRSHRLGSKKNDGDSDRPRPRPIIVKFVSYSTRSKVFRSKRHLKGTNIVITENLTKRRADLLRSTKQHSSVERAWTIDGRIQCLTTSGNFKSINHQRDLANL